MILCSPEEGDRRFAIKKISSIRNGADLGDASVRPFAPPKLNWNATSIRNLQDWTNATEPFITTSIPSAELVQFLTSPLQIPKKSDKERFGGIGPCLVSDDLFVIPKLSVSPSYFRFSRSYTRR